MVRITVKDVQNAVDTLNTMLPRHEVIFDQRILYYRPKGKATRERIMLLPTKRDCFNAVWAMIKAIELAGGNR